MTAGDIVGEHEISKLLSIPVNSLRAMRNRPSPEEPGPPYFKIGRSVRYSKIACAKWLESRTVDLNKRGSR